MSFQRNEDTANMFRTRKPSVTRTKHEKTNPILVPDAQSEVPHAIVPGLAPTKRETATRPVSLQHETLPPKVCTEGTVKDIPHQIANNLVAAQSVEDVLDWERALEYKPFFSDDDHEDMFREVREDRRIEIGKDPLINQILDMFPETPSDD